MHTSRIVKYVAQIKQKSAHNVNLINERTHGWLWILASAVRETLKPDTAITAAAIAYFAFFSLFPIILLSISVARFKSCSLMDQQLIIQKLEFIAPAIGQLLGQNIDEIVKSRGPVSGLALAGLIWSASTVFYMFTNTLNEIWSVKRPSAFWKRRGLAILFVLAFVGPILFLASFAGSMITHLRAMLPNSIVSLGGGISLVLVILLDMVLFMMLYMISRMELLPGVRFYPARWELVFSGSSLKKPLSFVSTYISVSNLVYGSVAAIIAFLAWAYLSGLIFLFGAYLSVSYFKFKDQSQETVVETYP